MEISSPIIQHFLNNLKFERRFSEHTAKRYAADLMQYADFLMTRPTPPISQASEPHGVPQFHPESDPATATVASATATGQPMLDINQRLIHADVDDARAYLALLNEKNYSKATIACKLATLRSFYKYLVKTNHTVGNPLTAIRTPKQDKKLPRFLEYAEVKKLLETPPLDNWLGARDRAILETLYSTGIRVSELVALNMDDIDVLGEVVHVRGKGKKERIAPISSSALQTIQHYMEFRNKRAQNNRNFDAKVLFVNKHGRRLSTRGVRRKMDKYLRMAGLDPDISPHTLRHSFATHMLNNGADLRSVQELLGLESLSSARVYAHLTSTDRLKEVYDNANPPETTTDNAATDSGLSGPPEGRSRGHGGPDEPEGPVRFHAHWHRLITPELWQTLLVYFYSGQRGFKGANDDFQRRMNVPIRPDAESSTSVEEGIQRGTEVTIHPELPGFRFNPPSGRVLWLEDWHCVEFRMQAAAELHAAIGQRIEGRVAFYVGPLLVGTTDLQVTIAGDTPHVPSSSELHEKLWEKSKASPYRKIFVSYSHKDTTIVDQLERAYRALGDDYLRDSMVLRSGETWQPALLDSIDRADVFQLCWSKAAKASPYVAKEWRHALGLSRNRFVRPMYWRKPMAKPPEELRDLHFAYVPFEEGDH